MTVKLSGPVVFGSWSDDVEEGTDLGDVFAGGYGWVGDTGDDAVFGYDGNDTMFGSDGADTLDGGAGSDLVDYAAAPGAVTADLGSGIVTVELAIPNAKGGVAEIDMLRSIERVQGSAFNDSIIGSAGDDVLAGGAGNDTLDGGLGTDTASYADAAGAVNASLTTWKASVADGSDVLRNFENLTGSAYADTLAGDGGANVLDGGAGADVLTGGGGNDTLVGGMGADTAVFSGARSDYAIATLPDGRVTVTDLRAGQDGVDTLTGIRHLQFADGAVELTGIDRLVASSAQSQSVTGLMDGSYVIAWQGTDADGSGIFFSRFDANGTPLGAVGQVNTTTAGQQVAPVIAALYDGGWVAVYQTASAAGWDVALQRFNADGSLNGAEVVLGSAGDQLAPAVTATIDGGFAVSWHAAAADGTTDVRVARFGWDGAAQGDAAVNTTVAGDQGGAAIAEQDNGYMVAWQSDNGSSHGVLVQQFRWDGEALGAEVKLATTGVVASVGIATLYGSAATAVSGTVVGWIQGDGNAATADDAVLVQRFDTAGVPVGTPVTVANGLSAHGASVTGLRDGGFIVVWDSVAADGTTTVMGRHYNASGIAAGSAWQVNQVAVTGQAGAPTVAEAADGRVIVSWTTTGTDGASRVWQQMIDYDGAAEFVASSNSGQPPAVPQFTVQAAIAPSSSMLAAAAHPQGAAAPVIDEGRFETGNLLVTGTGDPGAAITLYDAGVELARVTADAGGKWSVALADLRAGTHSFHAVAVDALGQASTASALVTLVVLGTLEGTAGHDDAAYFAALGADGTDQSLDGGAGNDTIDGGGGADTLAGGDGDDTFIVANDGVTIVEQASGGIDTVLASVDATLADNVENLVFTGTAGRTGHGNAGNNSLAGSSGNDALSGGAGNDTLSGGAGNDTLDGGTGDDVLSGGDGNDRYVVDATGDYIIESADPSGGTDTVTTTLSAYMLGAGLENLVRTGTAAFTGTGNALDNDIAGSTGNDRLDGGAGNDTLRGNGGEDTLAGGTGNDALYAGTGNAVVDGGDGTDTLYLERAQGAYTVARAGTALTLTSADGKVVTATNVERFVFAGGTPVEQATLAAGIVPANQRITGTAAAETLAGDTGNDTLDGAGGADTLKGGAGNDTYVVGNAGVTIVEAANAGSDTVLASVDFALADNVEHLVITGTAGRKGTGNALDNSLTGGSGNDALSGGAGKDTLTGGAGNDTLDGGAGDDVLAGGDGNDYYVVDSAGDTITDTAGTDTVATTLSAYTLGAGLENLVRTGTAAFTGTGNALDNDIAGSTGNDRLDGGAGNDTLRGNGGEDTLAGGTGNDALYAGTGNAVVDGGDGTDTLYLERAQGAYTVARAGTALTLTSADGKVVTATNVERFVFAGGTPVEQATLAAGIVPANQRITGTAAAETLAGDTGNDTLDGAGGADTLKGGAGNDTYVVGNAGVTIVEAANAGSDTVLASVDFALADNVEHLVITGTAGRKGTGNALDNSLTGGSGNDALSGGAGKDTLTGGAGNDTLDGGAGDDVLAGGDGNDYYVVDSAGDTITDTAGTDTVATTLSAYTLGAGLENLVRTGTAAFTGTGNALDNDIAGSTGNDRLDGGAGNDTLRGNGGEDTLAGGTGDDALYAGAGNATVDGGDGTDTLYLERVQGAYTVARVGTAVTLTSADGKVVTATNVERFVFAGGTPVEQANLFANMAPVNQQIGGTAGADALAGGSGNDTLDGGAGNDTMTGGAGDDTYVVDAVGDRIVEAADGGADLARVAIATRNATYVLDANVEDAIVTSTAAVNLTGNELANRLTGNAAANTLTGGAGDDTLDGAGGADKLDGGAGDDTYVVDVAGDKVVESAGNGHDTVLTSLATLTLAANVEDLRYTGSAKATLTGNAAANQIVNGNGGGKLSGLAGNDTLVGGTGNDSMIGGDGNDELRSGGGNDTLDGGAGTDIAVLAGDRAAWTVKRTADRALELTNGADKVVVRDVEQFAFADGTVAFDAMAVSTTATAWSDSLTGTAGDDTLDGKAGADTMAGLAGNDTYVVDSKDDVVVEAAGGGEDTVQVAIATAKTTYVLADNVEHAKVTSKAIINVTGNAAANALTGNAAANALSGLDGNDTLDGAAGNDVLDGGNGDDSLLGGAGNDKLEGGAGNDWLDGGAGSDTLAGGAGDDVYVVDAAGDRVTEAANAGIDTVRTSLAKYTLGAEVERLVYAGSAAFAGTGNALANFIEGGAKADKLAGGDGDDTLSGHAGNDTLDGGEGNDTAVFDGAQADYDVQVTATDIVLTGLGAKIVLKGVEMLAFSDRTLALSDMLVGIATPGNDSLTGTSGADTLDGKAGADTMAGLGGDDTYIVDHAGDRIVEAAGAGVDTARIAFAAANGTYVLDANVEDAIVTNKVATHVTGNDGANTLTGNAAADTLAGAGGNDSLYGQAGNDKLDGGAGDDLLDGGAGNDTMAGGAGDDVYIVDSKSDSVIELAGEGSDTVQTALAAYTLAANVENLFFTGTAAFTGTGNDLDNLITGGRGNDRLVGGAGNDTLAGGAGKDTLTGGAGSDVFRLDLASADTVADYQAGEDTVALDVTGLTLGGASVQWAETGGFSTGAGLVVFDVDAKTLDAKGAAAAIGSAAGAYADGGVALFAIDNGVSTAVFKFVSSGADALVSANELTQVATLTGVKDATLVDFALFHSA